MRVVWGKQRDDGGIDASMTDIATRGRGEEKR